ncbi:MAG: Eco57I restriction-modification methylase domain-containing protein [Caulobacteraceae bacterium]
MTELFAAAGIELPATDGKVRRARALTRALHVPLFNYKVIAEAKSRGAKVFDPTGAQSAAAADYARKIRDPKFLRQKETAVREILVQDVVQTVLGYRPYDPGQPYSLARERPIRGGAVDVALGDFNSPDKVDEIVAPFELKGPDCADLDRIMPGRGRSPVQQAWDYAIDAPGSRWVLVSNCLEIRLYAFGRGRDAYELFDLRKLDEADEHHRLWLILGAANLFGGITARLLSDTDSAYREVTNELYGEYKALRERLIGFLTNGGDGPRLGGLQAIEIAQKLLDRVLFIAFAQRTELMADRLLERAAKERSSFAPQPLWRNFLGLFSAVDRGAPKLDIPAYNGGLFAQDPIADEVILPDHLAEEVARLGQWDYRRQVPVTVLGHLFEQSITDIEALKAGAPPRVSRKKREGVVYTPDMVTRFVVERTVGRSLDERREALWREHGMEGEPSPARQIAFWRSYLDALRDFTIVDPACGSGAFLVAAFDEMARRYRDAVTALEGLDIEIDFDVFDQIVTRNLHGVDLNAESVEITRLSLWLKTARREHRLQNLEATVKDGDSLIADAAFTPRPFDWPASFPEVFAAGGFDVVIGNPPYVRMEHLKAIKPYLAGHYVVAADRTDLYAYFFEKGVRVLKPGGRLGYISSSTFFKTGSGENLRAFLADGVAVEAVVDFGDVQVFEGVTTYPAILTLRKGGEGASGDLTFLAIRDKLPDDLERAFVRLGRGSWQLEGDALAALRAKITAGRKTLGEVYGPPMRGIVTGLNEAFVINREVRDRLVAVDPKSEELLEPFLRGENIKRWRVESEDLFLINTPKGKVDIEAYPAIRNWLAPFREKLEARATKQEWWQLQQAQWAYQDRLGQPKIAWPHFQDHRAFTLDETGAYLNNKCFFLPTNDLTVLSLLNSTCLWFQLFTSARVKRGGYIEAEAQYVGRLSLPDISIEAAAFFGAKGQRCTNAARRRLVVRTGVRRRILDFAPAGRRKLNGRLEAWHELDFTAFRAEIKKAFRADIPLKERAEWEAYLAENAAEVRALTASIAAAEAEIDAAVYRLFDLTSDEITLLEASLAGQY